MKIKYLLFIFCLTVTFAKGQSGQSSFLATQPFGKIDVADLKMTECAFEKDANAMVLFNTGNAYYYNSDLIIERHKRIKIFNSKAKDKANIRIEYVRRRGYELFFLNE